MSDADDFADACRAAVAQARDLRYDASSWVAMIERHGAVVAAKRLLVNGDIQSGLLRLLRLGREDLTVEHAVLQERWRSLFDDDDRELARWRLEQARRELSGSR